MQELLKAGAEVHLTQKYT